MFGTETDKWMITIHLLLLLRLMASCLKNKWPEHHDYMEREIEKDKGGQIRHRLGYERRD